MKKRFTLLLLGVFVAFGLNAQRFNASTETFVEKKDDNNLTSFTEKKVENVINALEIELPKAVNSQSFDDVTFPPTGWTDVAGTYHWTRVTSGTHPTCATHSGAGMIRFNSYSITSGGSGELVTPAFDIRSIGTNISTVTFLMYRDDGYATKADKVEVYANTSATATGGTLIGTINRNITLAPIEAANGWYQYTFDMPAGFNGATNYVIFKAISGYGNNIFVDDISWVDYPLVVTNDAAITSITFPTNNFVPGTTPIKAMLKNNGLNDFSSCSIEYSVYDVTNNVQIADGLVYNYNQTLVAGTSEEVTLGTFTSESQTTYSITVTAALTGDEDATNDEKNVSVASVIVYSVPFTQDFTAYPPTDWTEATGLLAATTTLSGTTSNWGADGFANSGSTGAAGINIWSTGKKDWMFTPFIDLESKVCVLDFDLALTPYAGTTAGTFGVDDKFAVVISTDGGLTWSDANAVVYFDGTHTFSTNEHVNILLLGYTGVVKLGFYGESTVTNADNDLFVDNLSITEISDNDLTIVDISPKGIFYIGNWYNDYPQAEVMNIGSLAQSAYDVTFSFTNANTAEVVYTETVSSTQAINFGESSIVTATTLFSPETGTYSVTATVTLTGDENVNNNSLSNTAVISDWGRTIDIPAQGSTYLGSSVLYSGSEGLKLYSFGGNTASDLGTEVFVFDMMQETWAQTTSMPAKSVVGCATQLDDDEIFVHMGAKSGTYSTECYSFDVINETWTLITSLPVALGWTSATTINGYVYVAGGYSASAAVATVYRYEPTTTTWSSVNDLPVTAFGGDIITVGNKLVYTWGSQAGILSGYIYVGEIDENNPDLITWTTSSACPDLGTYKMTAAPISDNALIVTGGDYDGSWVSRPNSYIYNIVNDEWFRIDDKPTAVLGYAAGSIIIDDMAIYLTAAGNGNLLTEYMVVENTKPIVESLLPIEDETDVMRDAVVSITFDEIVTELYTPTISITDGTTEFATGYTLTGNVLEISHDLLGFETEYTVTVSAGAYMKNSKGGVNEEITWSFTTITEVTPQAGVLTFTTTELGTQDRTATSNVYDLGNICNTDMLTALTIEVLDDNINTASVDVYYEGNVFGQMIYTGSNNLWAFSPSSPFNWSVGLNTLTTQFVDLNGNTLDVTVNFTYVICNGTVTFTVTDGTNPIAGATISITGQSDLTTDGSGVASILLENDTYTYSVTATGFVPQNGIEFTVDGEDIDLPVVITPLSITENFESVTLSPNPTKDLLIINAKQNYNVIIIDVTGKVVTSINMTNNTTVIDLTSQAAGMYIVRLSNENGTATYKVIKQ